MRELLVQISRRCSKQLPDAVLRALRNWKLRFVVSVGSPPRAVQSVDRCIVLGPT